MWIRFGDLVDEGGREVKTDLISQAKGVVLDIGAGEYAYDWRHFICDICMLLSTQATVIVSNTLTPHVSMSI
jgi:hypothetical protein